MTALRVEDLFLADDLRALGGVHAETAERIDECTTHEEVEKIRCLLTWWAQDTEDTLVVTRFLEAWPDRLQYVEDLQRLFGLPREAGQ